jgi:hypothetical protein
LAKTFKHLVNVFYKKARGITRAYRFGGGETHGELKLAFRQAKRLSSNSELFSWVGKRKPEISQKQVIFCEKY